MTPSPLKKNGFIGPNAPSLDPLALCIGDPTGVLADEARGLHELRQDHAFPQVANYPVQGIPKSSSVNTQTAEGA